MDLNTVLRKDFNGSGYETARCHTMLNGISFTMPTYRPKLTALGLNTCRVRGHYEMKLIPYHLEKRQAMPQKDVQLTCLNENFLEAQLV